MNRLVCIFLLPVVWLTALSPSLATAAQLLCLSKDGHVAVEVKSLSRCMEHPDEPQAASPATAPDVLHRYAIRDAAHCGDCVDLEIARSGVTRASNAIPLPRKPNSGAPELLAVTAAAAVWTDRVYRRERLGPCPVRLANRLLVERRTVSLLI